MGADAPADAANAEPTLPLPTGDASTGAAAPSAGDAATEAFPETPTPAQQAPAPQARAASAANPYAGLAHRKLRVVLSAAITVALIAVYLAADVAGIAPGVLTTGALKDPAAAFRTARATGDPADLLAATADKEVDKAAATKLIDAFAATKGVGSSYAIAIADADGNMVSARNATTGYEPASTLKTLTALAATATLDMNSTLDTSVALTGGESDASGALPLRLVGNGDMMLSAGESDPDHINGRAGLATLAKETAKAVREHGASTVTLEYDDSLFGDQNMPDGITGTDPDYIYFTPLATMAVDEGKQWAAGQAPKNPDQLVSEYPTRTTDPAGEAAATFAELLGKEGITVEGDPTEKPITDDVRKTIAANTDGRTLATVSSAPLREILGFALQQSDNTLAELFGRLTGIASGAKNTPAAAAEAVTKIVGEQGAYTDGLKLADCSGLTTGSKVSVRTLISVQHLFAGEGTGHADAQEGLPVAGLSGTALHRSFTADTYGQVRLKTGTLGHVTSMAGNVVRDNGGTLAFAVIVNDPDDMTAAMAAVDAFVSQLQAL